MDMTINDMVKSIAENSDCVPSEEWEWQDCDIEGHEEGCFMFRCSGCGTIDRDCENK